MWQGDRRDFVKTAAGIASGALLSSAFPTPPAFAQAPLGERPKRPRDIELLFPRDRVPMAFIIDDSTCLVNMGHFCLPQFATAWPDREEYHRPWRQWPREIPDTFVRQFGGWCAEQGIKGKYSIVPNPACVGWLDRELPGWSRRQLQDSLKLVRELMLPNWDIHPEMITHTRVIDLKTGRPFAEISDATMENSFPPVGTSADQLADYIAYALRILKNCELPCEGITTPGGFGGRVKEELARAVREAVTDVFQPEIPHYFKYVSEGDESTEPKLELVSDLGTPDLKFVVNVPAGTGDWFGNWTGDDAPQPDRYANAEATSGRMVELIEQNRPAIMLCHWPGLYSHGSLQGFYAFQRVITSLHGRFRDRMQWMKLSEIARYWACRELADITLAERRLDVNSPFGCSDFTFRLPSVQSADFQWQRKDESQRLRRVSRRAELISGTYWADEQRPGIVFCVELSQGQQSLSWER